MNHPTSNLPVSKLYLEYSAKGRSKKLKKKCCCKYQKKKGKYCGSCPTLHVMMKNAGRNL